MKRSCQKKAHVYTTAAFLKKSDVFVRLYIRGHLYLTRLQTEISYSCTSKSNALKVRQLSKEFTPSFGRVTATLS